MEADFKKILIIDDDSFLLDMYALKFSKSNFSVTTALGPESALEKLRGGLSPDVMLLDIMMPVMDGLEATRQIRIFEQMNNLRIPIIALTANTFNADRERCLSYGMDDYLAKPLNMELLAQSFRSLGIIK